MSDKPKYTFPPRHDDDLIPRFDDISIPDVEGASSLEGDRPAGPRRSPYIVPRFDDDSIPDSDFTEMPGLDAPVVSSEADYVSSIRESMVSEEVQKAGPKGSSGLIQLITGSLKRAYSQLRKQPPRELRPEPLTSANIPDAELEDDFLFGRLGSVAVNDPLLNPDSDPTGYIIQDYVSDDDFFASNESPVEEFGLPDGSPITLLESGAIAALGKAEEDYRADDGEQQWMEGLRGQNAGQSPSDETSTESAVDNPAEVRPRSTGVTGQLRSFITGVLRPKKHTIPLILPDEMLEGRINRSLMTDNLHMPEPVEPAAQAEPTLFPVEDLETADTLLAERLQSTATDEQIGELTEELSPQWAAITEKPGIALASLLMELDELAETTETVKSPWDRWMDLDANQTDDLMLDEQLTNRFFVEDAAAAADLPSEAQAPVEQAFSGFQRSDEEPLSENLPDDRFTQFADAQHPTAEAGITAQLDDYVLSIDEQLMLCGQAQPSGPAANEAADKLRPGDIWGTVGEQTISEKEGWSAPIVNASGLNLNADGEYVELFPTMPDEDHAAAYLGGLAALTYNAKESSQSQSGRLLRHALERSATPATEPVSDSQNMREIALKDYEGEGLPDEETRRELAAEAEDAAEEEAERESHTLNVWLAKRTLMEKILLAEAVIVTLAMVIALPIFLVIILRGPSGQAQGAQPVGINWPMPRPLPANVPYPTSLTLPGGWKFALGKSTFLEGQWKPSAAEWLEGTEVRRVVALPWNRQTQAVMQTFQVGDVVELSLTNNDLVKYKVDTIERMPSDDSTILTGRKPALVIVLYQENADERWVAVCSPSR